MTYVVLARKWRPQRFSDVLGQEHVTRTLTNAIAAERIAHAFLFSGPRGVGKTSAARILAKALCCEAGEGPRAEPCGTCRQCVEITEGRSTDIFEIDAASHTGVDNIREIIDNARYLPSSARFKIYVIDEVHMLSTGAFNALLKTLEEPPEHVKFVLATTDVHKVPVTVKSRCQRYDFRRIALSRISERLSFILTEEEIDHDATALSLVAREAEGSMRDAQSLLEQVLAFAADRRLEAPLIREALGVVDGALIERARAALLGHEPGTLIEIVQDVHERGLDLSRFIGALIEHVRDLLAAQVVATPDAVLDRPADEIEGLVEAAKSVSPQALERIFERLCRIAEDIGRSSHPRFALEIGLAGLAQAPVHMPVEHLVAQLDRVESMLGGKPAAPSRGSGRTPPSSGPNPGRSGGARRAASPPPGAPQDAPRGGARPREPGPRRSPPSPAGSNDDSPSDPAPAASPPSSAPAAEPIPRAAPPEARRPIDAPLGDGRAPRPDPEMPPWVEEDIPLPDEPPAALAPEPPPEPTSAPPTAAQRETTSGPPPTPNAPAPRRSASQDGARGPVWLGFEEPYAQFVGFVRARRPAVAATLMQVRPLAFGADRVELACETAFDLKKLGSSETRQALEALLEEHLGAAVPLVVHRAKTADADAADQKTLNEVEEEHAEKVRREKVSSAKEDPKVNAVVDALSGTIANIRVLDG